MNEFEKAQKLHGAFSTMVKDFIDEGRTDLADRITKALLDVPDTSMAKLYDILQSYFAPKSRPMEEVVGPTENIGSVTVN